MTKIREIVEIKGGYTSYVDLYEEFNDPVKNQGRMSRYKPITAHRVAFERIAKVLNPLDRRFYFLRGSYGTGKSHLLLMTANYFANPSDLPEIEAFFHNYKVAQSEVKLKPGEALGERKADSLKAARAEGKYLVAICRSDWNLEFEGAILRAIEEALEQQESNLFLDTHYQEALRRIEDWESRKLEARFYNDFLSELNRSHNEWTLEGLTDELKVNNEEALKVFKECFKRVTDTDFTYNRDNLEDILSDMLSMPEFQEYYKGIVILYDEFGSAIDEGLVKYQNMLGFAQYCASSTLEKGGTVAFIATGHRAFRNHGRIGDLNAETLEARVEEIGLETQGMEDIIAAIVEPQKDKLEWREQVEPQSGKFTWFSKECNRLNLFDWLPAPKIEQNIIENIYPMHPMATFALLRMASEVGADNRSVFKFFSPEFETGEHGWKNVQPFSFPDFIENNPIKQNEKLVFYTTDLLADYYQDDLIVSNHRNTERVRTAVANYEATLQEFNDYFARQAQEQMFDETDELMERIIKTLLVHVISSTAEVPITNTEENIFFSLNMVLEDEKQMVRDRLNKLCQAGILYNNKGVYELTSAERKDVERIIVQYKANPDNRPSNLLQTFLTFNPLKSDERYLEAKDYNGQYQEDKRLKVVFATPEMLGEKRVLNGMELDCFEALEAEREEDSFGANGYEGTSLYVFCENDLDIETARQGCIKNTSDRVVIAIPRNPIHVFDTIFTLLAMRSNLMEREKESFGPYENMQLSEIRKEVEKELKEAKDSYFSNKKVNWFGVRGADIPVQENQRYDVADRIMHNLFDSKRNTFPHNEFNKSHINLSGRVKAILVEGGDLMVDLGQTVRINWSWADNRGGIRYVRKCFVDHQALKIISMEGDVRFLDVERDVQKFRSAMPAYAKLLSDLAELEGKGAQNLVNFLKPYYDGYGQGEIALTLLMLLARRFYGDSLRFKRDPNSLIDIRFITTNEMLDLVRGGSPSAVVLFEPMSKEELQYFSKVHQIFSPVQAPADKTVTINESYNALLEWWSGLPIVARSMVFYEGADRQLVDLLNQARNSDPYIFIKKDLLAGLQFSEGEVITKGKLTRIEVELKAFQATAQAVKENVEQRVLEGVKDIFNAGSALDLDIQEAMKDWYNNLSSAQADRMGSYHNNDSKPLVTHTQYTNIRRLLFETYPQSYRFAVLADWGSEQVDDYLRRLTAGKRHIEENAPQMGLLDIYYLHDLREEGNQVAYKGELIINASITEGDGVIYYTDDGSDPRDSRQRHKLNKEGSLTVKGNRTIRLVVTDESGNCGSVRTIEAIDDLHKYKIRRLEQKTMGDERINFVFPVDKDSAKTVIHTMLDEIDHAKLMTNEELEGTVLGSLEVIKEKKG